MAANTKNNSSFNCFDSVIVDNINASISIFIPEISAFHSFNPVSFFRSL